MAKCNCEWAYRDQADGTVFYCRKCKRPMTKLADMKQMVDNYARLLASYTEQSRQLEEARLALAGLVAEADTTPEPEGNGEEKPKRVRRKKVEEPEPEAVPA